MIYIKDSNDIKQIKEACKIWKLVKQELIKNTRVGITTKELDEIANKVILENGGTPSFYQYAGFPGYICISVNDQVIHGIPDGYKLKKEDLVTYDVGVTYNEHFCDSAFSVSVDPDNQINKKIMDATLECLEESVKECMPGNHTGDISNKIEEIAYKNGYEVITDYGGHGCGNKIHEDPIILCYGDKNTGTKLKPGMVICVEPMLMTGSNKYFVDKKNNWTVYAKNHKQTCHWEYQVWIKDDGYEILTK